MKYYYFFIFLERRVTNLKHHCTCFIITVRTRWVEYKDYYGNMSSVEAGWHYWLGYGVDVPPNATAKEFKSVRAYPTPDTHLHGTGTSGAFVTYNTVKPKFQSWKPVVQSRT